MTATKQNKLTAEEKRFIVQTLQQLELRGTAEALAQAIRLIESITIKLTADEGEG